MSLVQFPACQPDVLTVAPKLPAQMTLDVKECEARELDALIGQANGIATTPRDEVGTQPPADGKPKRQAEGLTCPPGEGGGPAVAVLGEAGLTVAGTLRTADGRCG